MDFADAVWAAVDRMLAREDAAAPLTDAAIAEAMGQPLPVVRAVLDAGDETRPRVEKQPKPKQPWTVHPR
ncbi:hypothetical protein [Nocardioides bruguierae]|uniref:hypothetical protein n=1 Tax=Nocardioides bruguierae TaxID=2945102 RepID=UPI002021CD74|nr:hypothetical protein [Nocardioides bruguierae]MCL8026094.1 hypothetical protein [Nocardioides bruguierae]